MTEAMAEGKDKGKPIHALLLDASKAFDLVFHNGMLNSVHDHHIRGDIWMLLNDSYAGITSTLKWNNELSRKFQEGQGMRQGAKGSPNMFTTKGNKFLNRLEESRKGMHIGSTYIGDPTCADDIALLAQSAQDLQIMALLAWEESKMERFLYSTTKTKYMIFDPRPKQNINEIEMGDKVINKSKMETHVGIVRTEDTKSETTIHERIKAGRRTWYSLMGTGPTEHIGVHPQTSSKMIRVQVMPTVTHGLETLKLTKKSIEDLEIFRRDLLKRIQQLPKETANSSCHILTGTIPVEAHLDALTLGMYVRVLLQNTAKEKDIVHRQLALKNMESASWTQKIRKLLHKYDLPSAYDILMKTPPAKEWRRRVKKAIYGYWIEKIKEDAHSRKTLKYLNIDIYRVGRLHDVWGNVGINHFEIKRAQVKTGMMVGRYLLGVEESRYRNTDPTCELCNAEEEDIAHFLLRCPALENVRGGYMRKLREDLQRYDGDTEMIFQDSERLMQLILDCTVTLQDSPARDKAIGTIEPTARKLLCVTCGKKLLDDSGRREMNWDKSSDIDV